jgi:hypothetical protein
MVCFADGDIEYIGDHKDNQKDGAGIEYDSDGNKKYVGEF